MAGPDGYVPFQPYSPSPVATMDPDLVSNFEQPDQAIVVPAGAPPRQGTWFSYDDGTPTCQQMPLPSEIYRPAAPPVPSPGGGLALHASWSGCTSWGAGVGARLSDDGHTRRSLPYDLSAYSGLTFWAMPGGFADPELRVTLPMTDDVKVVDGGDCDEARLGEGKCSDAYGAVVAFPLAMNTWTKVVVSFNQPGFAQQGWGARFPWNPAHVMSIQIQSSHPGNPANFWIDDVELTR